jgi:membrane-associated phospholipid phosphatase
MSRQFNFGFFEHGIFWGWPSSHTTVAFATMVALYIVLKEKHRTLGILALMYAWYIGIAVPFQIHWFSEFVAGILFGTLVGVIVGKNALHLRK